MNAVIHPRLAARRGARRAGTWWARAWVRAVEEAAYSERDLVTARALSRSGEIGAITVDEGALAAAVHDGDVVWTVTCALPTLDAPARDALVEAVAAEPGRLAALLAGDLPYDLVEHAEEAGVELLPYGTELAATCTCQAWAAPCVHALAVLHQVAWLAEADPFVLLQLRGLPRDDLLARLHARDEAPSGADDLEAGLDAALRATRLLELLDDAGR